VRPSVTSDKVHVRPISKYSSIFEHILENIHRICPLRPIPNRQNRPSVCPSRPSTTSLPPNTSDKTTLLFIISLEPLLRWLERGDLGYKLKTSQYTINSTTYAYDLAIIRSDIKHIQPQINKIDKFCQWAGMELGISKCAITGCPNNKYMPATTFKAYIQSHNITYRNQPIPVLGCG
jgi:hypothetical protein